MSFDLEVGEIVPLESLVPRISPNGNTAPATVPADTTRPPRSSARSAPTTTPAPGAAPAVATKPVPTESTPRGQPPAPRLRPNRLLWRGRLAADPEVRRSQSGIDFCAVRVLQDVLDTNRRPQTQAIEAVMFRERAHDFARTFQKGDLVEIMGELRIRDWQDRNGAKHTSVSLHPSEEIALVSRPQRV